jgi:hypothetical protein
LPAVRDALEAIEQGGYPEALARAACLLARKGEPLPLARIELKAQMAREYAELLPPLAAEEWHAIRGRQEIICRYEPDAAIQTLPRLLGSGDDRARFLTVLERLLADKRIETSRATAAQRATLERIRSVLQGKAGKTARPVAARRMAVTLR